MLFKKEVSIYRGLGRVKGTLLDGQILSNSRKPSLPLGLKGRGEEVVTSPVRTMTVPVNLPDRVHGQR